MDNLDLAIDLIEPEITELRQIKHEISELANKHDNLSKEIDLKANLIRDILSGDNDLWSKDEFKKNIIELKQFKSERNSLADTLYELRVKERELYSTIAEHEKVLNSVITNDIDPVEAKIKILSGKNNFEQIIEPRSFQINMNNAIFNTVNLGVNNYQRSYAGGAISLIGGA